MASQAMPCVMFSSPRKLVSRTFLGTAHILRFSHELSECGVVNKDEELYWIDNLSSWYHPRKIFRSSGSIHVQVGMSTSIFTSL